MARVIHLRKKCIGCGVCAAICPEIFKMVKGLAIIKKSIETKKNGEFELELKNKSNLECVKSASRMCPIKIIKILP